MNNYKFSVKMSCYGCVGAIIKALANTGITSVDIDFDAQLVRVKSDKSCTDVLECISSSGKKATVVA